MKVFILAVVFVGCAFAAPSVKRNRGSPPTFSCEGKEEGLYADHHRNCQVYYICKDGTQDTGNCADGKRFSEKIWACLPEDHVECPAPVEKRNRGGPPIFSCDGRKDGFYADHHRNCQVYYMCKEGEQKTDGCKSGERFSEEKWACLPSDQVECPVPVEKRFRGGAPVFSCEGKDDGVYPDLFRLCHTYHSCVDGVVKDTSHCPAGTLFDTGVNACLNEGSTTCPTLVKRGLTDRVKVIKAMDDRLVRDLELLLRKIQKNKK